MADLLRIRSIFNRQSTISHSVFYHPGLRNTMADDVLRRFDLNRDSFLSFFTCKYQPQFPCSWKLCHPPKELISSVICDLRKQSFAGVTYQTPAPQHYISTGFPSALTSALTTGSKTLGSQPSSYFKCMSTGSVKDTTPDKIVSGQTWLLRRDVLSPIFFF